MGSETKRVGPFHVKTCEHGVRKCERCVFEDWKRSLAIPTADVEADFAAADKHASELLAAFGDHPRLTPALSPVSAVIHAYLAIRAAHHSADASKTLPPDVQAVVDRVRKMFAGRDSFLRHEEYDAEEIDAEYPVTFADLRTLLAHLSRTEG